MSNLKWTSYRAVPCSTSEVVSSIIEDAVEYGDGRLESMERKLDKLVQIVAAMAELMTDRQQRELMGKISFGWEEVK